MHELRTPAEFKLLKIRRKYDEMETICGQGYFATVIQFISKLDAMSNEATSAISTTSDSPNDFGPKNNNISIMNRQQSNFNGHPNFSVMATFCSHRMCRRVQSRWSGHKVCRLQVGKIFHIYFSKTWTEDSTKTYVMCSILKPRNI